MTLLESGEISFASIVEAALDGSEQELIEFLKSNELWGGAGSIADQAACASGRAIRRKIEAALIRLGNEQSKDSLLNPRTESWVDAFSEWQKQGV